MSTKPECLCCQKDISEDGPRRCPLCDHEFKGNGWDGIDRHWRAKHTHIMPYEKFWASMCAAHRAGGKAKPTERDAGLLEIHRRLFEFLENQNIPFLPRKQSAFGRSIEDGYYFRGADHYAQTTFWTGDDANAHVYSIAFVVLRDSHCYLEISGETEEKWKYLEGLQKYIGGFETPSDRKKRWVMWFEGGYLQNLKQVMDDIRPRIDQYMKDNPSEYFRPLADEDCREYIDKVSDVFHGRNEQRIARLCWNTNNWESPSGSSGKSTNKDSYEHTYGFGHEEWLFDMAKLVDGYHYAFIQPIGSLRRKTYAGKTFDLSFYSIDEKSRKRFWIGNVRNVEVIDEAESSRIHEIYIQNGWLSEMSQQLKAVGSNHEIFEKMPAEYFATIRFRPDDLDLLDAPTEFSADDPAISLDRYNLKHKVNNPKLSTREFVFTPGHNKKKRSTTVTQRAKQKSIELIHNKIQDCMYHQLVAKHGKENVGTELGAGYGGSIDLVVKLGGSGKYDFYEIKAGVGMRACIRDALSQLLEYAYFSQNDEVGKLIIVSRNVLTEESRSYLELLRKKFNLPVYYQRFNMETQQLEAEPG